MVVTNDTINKSLNELCHTALKATLQDAVSVERTRAYYRTCKKARNSLSNCWESETEPRLEARVFLLVPTNTTMFTVLTQLLAETEPPAESVDS